MKFFGFVICAAAFAGSASLAPAMAGGFTAVETHGAFIETYANVNGGQLGVYQNGRYIGTHAEIYGDSAVALSQTGNRTVARVAVRGNGHDVGAALSNGARLDADIGGSSSGAAIYANGGSVSLQQYGTRNTTVINVNGRY